jgi:GT2 family glycosyltransferase/predicted O-methyltransferase YrrM
MSNIIGMAEALKIDGWMSEEELSFLGGQAARVETALQIGCYKGRSSYVIGKNIRGHLLDIDSFVGDHGNTLSITDLAATYIKNIGDLLGTKIKVMIGNSHDLLKVLNAKFDLVFIDGSHSYGDVKKDIELSMQLMSPGGLICGHDYSHSIEVKQAVDEIFGGKVKSYNNTSIWYIANEIIPSMDRSNELKPVVINIQTEKPFDISLERLPAKSFSAVYCVYDDDVWLRQSLSSVYSCCDRIFFLVGDKPWNGDCTDNSSTLCCIHDYPDPHRKIEVITGIWENEADQRNAGLRLVEKEGQDYCFVVDADEIYDPTNLKNMMNFAISHPEIECWHMTWDTYWKSPFYKIEPREPFKPVVFIKSGGLMFVKNRDVGGDGHGLIPPEIGFCHHLSYARTDKQVRKKIGTFSHAQEIKSDWFQSIWKRWDSDHSLSNLHPTHPSVYQRAVSQPTAALPPVLRDSLEGCRRGGKLTTIIILSHNQLGHTKKCLESVQKHTPEAHEIIFVDNASTDGTVEWLKQVVDESPNYKLIENKTNLGFAAGNNQGLAWASGDYLLLLNNDTIVTKGWLARMLALLEGYVEVGVVGPVSNYVSGPQQVPLASYRNLDEMELFANDWAREHQGQSLEFPRVVGFCLLAKREVIEKIGGLDERFGNGNFEDDDYCLRAAMVGYKTRIAKDVFIHHTGNQTFRGAGIDYQASLGNNWEVFKKKWHLPQSLPYGAKYLLNSEPENLLDYYIPLPSRAEIPLTSYNNLGKDEDAVNSVRLFKNKLTPPIVAGNWEQAIQLLKEAISSNETRAAVDELWNDLGYSYFMANQLCEAETAFNRGLAINPQNLDLLNNLASLYLHQEDYNQATHYLNRALYLNPKDVGALRTFGDCAVKLQRFDVALHAYVTLRRLLPDNDGLDQMIFDLARLSGPCIAPTPS